MKAKPIFTVGIPMATFDMIKESTTDIENKMPDYNILCFCSNGEDVLFECFNVDDLDTVAFEEFKAAVLEKI